MIFLKFALKPNLPACAAGCMCVYARRQAWQSGLKSPFAEAWLARGEFLQRRHRTLLCQKEEGASGSESLPSGLEALRPLAKKGLRPGGAGSGLGEGIFMLGLLEFRSQRNGRGVAAVLTERGKSVKAL
jgi:hypothetical protein